MRIIGYRRVSTARQGARGLGIAAQRQAIDRGRCEAVTSGRLERPPQHIAPRPRDRGSDRTDREVLPERRGQPEHRNTSSCQYREASAPAGSNRGKKSAALAVRDTVGYDDELE
jgi:hypothetical protein